MIFIAREESFLCEHCQKGVEPLGSGSYRNHCPYCLYSKHVDENGPGDRASTCQGLLEPVGIDTDTKKGFVILYRCLGCGKTSRNKAAPDDDLQSFTQDMHSRL